ncbi:hypothetical protein GCM10007898_16490 [Dyella flagellata]|uniref:Uncharacterized protein n=1 Tax=Dyella flagellata TaxID=1867833 RepID=A0ABQ5XC24_9GAMM|nr:hypothetical protein GCM10007898_16490 [Dyella flagellata]
MNIEGRHYTANVRAESQKQHSVLDTVLSSNAPQFRYVRLILQRPNDCEIHIGMALGNHCRASHKDILSFVRSDLTNTANQQCVLRYLQFLARLGSEISPIPKFVINTVVKGN